MDYKEIDQLLSKYWEGATSLEEEDRLNNYFLSDKVEVKHQSYISLFQFYQKERQVKLPVNFEARFESNIKESTQTQAKYKTIRTWLSRAAVIALLVFSSVFVFSKLTDTSSSQGAENKISASEKQAAKEAYIQMKLALELVSNKLNKGKSKAVEGIHKVKKASIAFD